MRSKEQMDNAMTGGRASRGGYRYDMTPKCPDCNIPMKYIFGEVFECPSCKRQELTDFGKIKEYLEKAGPQPAIVIANETGIPVKVIDNFLRQGRVEIPDGSAIYIKCESCGVDIRYGRYCPECMARMNKEAGGKSVFMSEVGEKPTSKGGMAGKMHILETKLKTRK